MVYIACIGSLAGLSLTLALRMSFFRLAGSPGESDPNSNLNDWYLHQQLASEWNPLLMILFLALQVQKVDSPIATTAAVIVTASRFAFFLKRFVPVQSLKFPLSFVAMNATYVGGATLVWKLLESAQ